MTDPGNRPKKSLFASFAAAMAPAVPEETDGPIVRPRTVMAAMVLAIVGGVIFLAVGAIGTANASKSVDSVRDTYRNAIAQCTQYVGGYGSAANTTAQVPSTATSPLSPASTLTAVCPSLTVSTWPDSEASSFHTQIVVVSLALAVLGVLAIVSGYFIRDGKKWARRLLLVAVIVAVLVALLLQISNALTLVGSLFLIVAMVLCYVGRSGLFFLLVSRSRQH